MKEGEESIHSFGKIVVSALSFDPFHSITWGSKDICTEREKGSECNCCCWCELVLSKFSLEDQWKLLSRVDFPSQGPFCPKKCFYRSKGHIWAPASEEWKKLPKNADQNIPPTLPCTHTGGKTGGGLHHLFLQSLSPCKNESTICLFSWLRVA